MTAVQVLAALRARRARVEVRGRGLHIEAPKGALGADLKAAIVAQKAELVDLLTMDPQPLIAAMFDDIAAFWVEGAELPPVDLENAIEEAALAGDSAALTAALSVYRQAAQEACARVHPPAAVRLKGTAAGEIWLIADSGVLTEETDISRSGIPVFTFDQSAVMLSAGVEAMLAASTVRRVCPSASILGPPNSMTSLQRGDAENPLDPPQREWETFWKEDLLRKAEPPVKNPQPCAECGRVTWRIVLNPDPLHHVRVMEPLCNDCWLQRVRDSVPPGEGQ